jgi:hypothetical protein
MTTESNSDSSTEANSKSVLVPLEQRQVDFYGDSLVAALVEENGEQKIYIPLRPLCEYLGLDWSSQLKRTRRDEVLSESLNSVVIMTTELKGVGRGKRETLCILLEQLPGWLFGLETGKVKVELRDKIIKYRRECFKVLWNAFQTEALSVVNQVVDEANDSTLVALEHVRASAQAIVQLAEQQIALQQQITKHETRLNDAARIVGNLQKRITVVESQLAPPALISNEQSEQISSRVKALAEYLTKLDPQKRTAYGAIFAELYRRYGVSDYKHIHRSDFEHVMEFLNDWREAAGAGRLPNQLTMFGND